MHGCCENRRQASICTTCAIVHQILIAPCKKTVNSWEEIRKKGGKGKRKEEKEEKREKEGNKKIL